MAESKNVILVPIVTGLLLLSGTPAAAQASWKVVPSPNELGSNELLGVAGAHPAQVWAVGKVVNIGIGGPATSSQILHFNGVGWKPVEHPRFPTNQGLTDVTAPTAREAWAVGSRTLVGTFASRTLIQRWDGVQWGVELSPSPNPEGSNTLSGVAAVPGRPGELWAVGAYSAPLHSQTLILRRAGIVGIGWHVVPSPSPASDNFLKAVDATGPNDAWAVGFGLIAGTNGQNIGLVQHWDGLRWSSEKIKGLEDVRLHGVDALAPNDVWAVGDLLPASGPRVPLILHFDGFSWSRVPAPSLPSGGVLKNVVALSPSNVYAVGATAFGLPETLVLRWDGRSWTREPAPSPASRAGLNDAATVAPGTVWAVGSQQDTAERFGRNLTLFGAAA